MIYYARGSRLPLNTKWMEFYEETVNSICSRYSTSESADDRLEVTIEAVDMDAQFGNFYKLLLDDKLRLSSAAISYIKDLLKALAIGGKMTDVFLTDRIPLLKHHSSTVYLTPSWSEEETILLNKLQHLSNVRILKYFAKGPGISKYFELLRLRVLDD